VESINARRTSLAGTPEALAIASAISPSCAPCRSSPTSKRRKKSCSWPVARPSSARKLSSFRRAEPAPDSVAIRDSVASTSASWSVG
jgi:hypothetical protein